MYTENNTFSAFLTSPTIMTLLLSTPIRMPIQLRKQPMDTWTKFKANNLRSAPFTYYEYSSNPTSVLAPYRYADWVYVVRSFQTSHNLFYKGFFINFISKTLLWRSNSFINESTYAPKIFQGGLYISHYPTYLRQYVFPLPTSNCLCGFQLQNLPTSLTQLGGELKSFFCIVVNHITRRYCRKWKEAKQYANSTSK